MLLVQRTIEGHLYFAGLLHRWRDHWSETRDAYFGGALPRPLLVLLGPMFRRKALAQARGQGLGLRPPEQVDAEASADLEAVGESRQAGAHIERAVDEIPRSHEDTRLGGVRQTTSRSGSRLGRGS